MASAAQITANQANARLSTGPQSPEGKARSVANSTKDGFTSKKPVFDLHESPEFESYRLALQRDTRPEGPIEEEYFHRLLTAGWNLRRARKVETSLLAETDPTYDEVDAARLNRTARYRRELERSYDRALSCLRQLQTQRMVLLQQPANIVAAVASIAPLAELTEITKRTDPVIGRTNPFLVNEGKVHASREAAIRASKSKKAAQNEAISPKDADLHPDLVKAANSPELNHHDRQLFVDLYQEANRKCIQETGALHQKMARQ
ncbi:MAG: hypothetical protein HY821_09005 [Acidobacteria bacterium]|nr:hypothetical protein [Acidobacteriota bacterium]